MSAVAEPQTSIYEKQIANGALETALERREELREPKKEAGRAFKQADEAVKALLAHEELDYDAVVRIGRFIVTKRFREGGKTVEFETRSQERYSIKLFEEAE